MPEITQRRGGEMLRGLFELLLEHPEGLEAKVALAELARRLPPTEFEASDYPSRPGIRRYEKLVRFRTISAVKAGWMVKERGRWSLTDDGRDALARFTDPGELMREVVRLYQRWKREHRPVDEIGEPAEGEEQATVTLEEAEEAAWSEIRDYLVSLPPYEFQNLVAALLRAMGYHVSWVAPPGPDRGVDIVAHTDPLGASAPRIKVQVKRRADRISAGELRSFMAVLGAQDVGIFVAAGGFTPDAEAEARSQEARRITLIDLERLFELWVEHYDRLLEEDRHLLPLRPVHYLAPR